MGRRKNQRPLVAQHRSDYDRTRRDGIAKITTLANWCIWAVTAAIALAFAGFTLKDIPFSAISNANPQYFQAILLSIYVWCWALGTTFDTNIQSSVYLVDPFGGRIRWGSLVAVLSLAAISLVLVLVRFNELYFSLALLVFTSLDIATWLYLRQSFLPPIIEASRVKYKADHDEYGLLQLETVVSLIIGNWKWWRQGVLFGIVALMVLLAISGRSRDFISGEAQVILPAVPSDAIRPLLQDFILLLFLFVSEVWAFAVRLETLVAIRLLNDMERRFELRRRPGL
jgi:hypothetical protein